MEISLCEVSENKRYSNEYTLAFGKSFLIFIIIGFSAIILLIIVFYKFIKKKWSILYILIDLIYILILIHLRIFFI